MILVFIWVLVLYLVGVGCSLYIICVCSLFLMRVKNCSVVVWKLVIFSLFCLVWVCRNLVSVLLVCCGLVS